MLTACTAKNTPHVEQVKVEQPKSAVDRAVKPPPSALHAPGDKSSPGEDDPCLVLPKLSSQPPLVINGKNLVLTRLLKPCVTRDGVKGVDRSSQFLAMGFPCTGGSGRIEIKGHYNNPHLISFLLGTDCGMAPATKEEAQGSIAAHFDFPKTLRAAAYTPFVVQYWEVPSVNDADVGYIIELRQTPAVEGMWRRFQQHESIPVKLYGRENTWSQGDHFYSVDGNMKMTGRTAFQLEVSAVKSLSREEIANVKQRCENLKPRRNCADVF